VLFEESPPELPLEESPLFLDELSLLFEASPLAPEALSLVLTFFLSPVLKSVSYHPLPFNLKATAEIIFFNSGLLQSGQTFNGSSLSFCSFSIL